MATLRSWGASAVTTFTARLCLLTAQLNAEIKGTNAPLLPWGAKDTQRRILRVAGVSKVESTRISDESSLHASIESVGFPVIVKAIGGVAGRDTWLLSEESDGCRFMRESGVGKDRNDMLAERFIVGDYPSKPYLGDCMSVEVFRFGQCGLDSGPARSYSFVTDCLFPAWPCRETGFSVPSQWLPEQQKSLISAAGNALDATGSRTGVFDVEMKLALPSSEIIEVNGRLGGFLNQIVRYGTGVDLGRLALSCSLDRHKALDLVWKRCMVVLFYQLPPQAARITKAPSCRGISWFPGVLSVDTIPGVGTAVDWRNGVNLDSTRLWITADNHSELRSRLIDIATYLTDEFGYADDTGQPVRDRT